MIATIEGFTLREIYESAYVGKFGLSFEDFARDPIRSLKRIGQRDAIAIMRRGERPLLPAQVRQRQANESLWQDEGHDIDALYRSREISLDIRHAPSPAAQPDEALNMPPTDPWWLPNQTMETTGLLSSDGQLAGAQTGGAWLGQESAWPSISASTFEFSSVNPATGLPMIGDSMLDVGGNTFGTGSSLFS